MATKYLHRRFQVWEYTVSHGSLLVRSPKNQQVENNVDVVLTGVEYLAVPRVLDGLSIEPPMDEDLQRLNSAYGAFDRGHVFVLASGGNRHLVVAASCQISENDGDIFDSPF